MVPRPLAPATSTRPVNVLLLAVAGAVTVANIYFPQPLLAAVARGLDVSERTAGLIASAAQIGYALGILLLVPLADSARLRRLTSVLLALTSAALLVAAAAPDVVTLTVATLALSTTTVLPQILTPVAAVLAGPGRQGRVVGLVGLGLTLGSTLSRTVSGAVTDASGSWRVAYAVAAVATAALLLVLPRRLPERLGSRGDTSYARLLAGLPRLLAVHRELRISALLGACVFAAFSVFWSVLAFHLAAPPLGYGPGAAGLFGVLTLPAALLSAAAGSLADRYGASAVNAGGLVCAGLGLSAAGIAPYSPVALVAGANLLVVGVSSCQVASQARIFGIGRAVAARVNTVFMLATFGGGALGSLAGTWLYAAHGWTAALLAAGACVAVGGLVVVRARPAAPSCVRDVTREAGGIRPRIPQGES
ncbi:MULTISPECIES: MFS transporter [Streptomyces]|uniref:Putative MFS family arabinose efflux permease n=1 Tax=Streptomyces nymphaeiformis TaxID=2663842 RepID=A0A7W7U309_9ACTN|nr:MFS transporter [Streptomyces nymphaeiformis]MBB4984066.1 putative MFS family arabinose efflux permease [Streptomyces nymphaeiformis]